MVRGLQTHGLRPGAINPNLFRIRSYKHGSFGNPAAAVRARALCLQDAFACDVRPAIGEWRAARGLPSDPMDAFRQSGYLERVTKERSGRSVPDGSAYA